MVEAATKTFTAYQLIKTDSGTKKLCRSPERSGKATSTPGRN